MLLCCCVLRFVLCTLHILYKADRSLLSPLRKTGTSIASSSASPLNDPAKPPPRHPLHPEQQELTEDQGPTMLLEHTTDIYDGVTVDKASLPHGIEEFTSLLETSLKVWRSTGKKGVWLKVITRLAWLMNTCTSKCATTVEVGKYTISRGYELFPTQILWYCCVKGFCCWSASRKPRRDSPHTTFRYCSLLPSLRWP